MKPIHTFRILPSLPEPLKALHTIAFNLRWAWNHDTIELFRRLDRDLWETVYHNPVRMLGTIDQAKLEAAATDAGFLAHLDRVGRDLEDYVTKESTWYSLTHGENGTPLIAYFSAEFGLAECLSVFAGGLGVLAGDHLKSASDLGIPLIGVGLLYQQGYFNQYLTEAGWQQEHYEDNDFHTLPLIRETRENGEPLLIEVAYPERLVKAQIWRAQVGRVRLYLLDTNIPDNADEDRDITNQLYGGNEETRIRQEIMLGIGGIAALSALGLEPTVTHINEGHSAFLALERVRRLMASHNIPFHQAREAVSAGLIFTTHTPVPAGHDYFPPDLMDRYFSPQYHQALKLSRKAFLGLGRQNPNHSSEPFCMTILAMRMAAFCNGVSRLHGRVSREMWQPLFPEVPSEEIPITHITNGVHYRTWISQETKQLYDRYLGPRWREEPADQSVWQRALHISNEELWRTHEQRRDRLVGMARRRLRLQLERRGAPTSEIAAADEVLDTEALTIGFARRFATYKRATLILRDTERLAALLNDPDRPVQIIFAGKAHPHDDHGKALIQKIVALAREEPFRKRLVFIEDYDMAVARSLVQGSDVWLNTPRRPREASGTSGMKAAANAVMNLSILDGWWDEAYSPQAGWAIGRGETYEDPDHQDQVEAEALYDILERDIIPTFFDRDGTGLPRRWTERMKQSVASLCHRSNTHRMVSEYTNRFYVPADTRFRKLNADGMKKAQELADWKAHVQKNWGQVRVEKVDTNSTRELHVGDAVHAQAWISLGALTPQDVRVELYMGRVDARCEIIEAEAVPMEDIRIEDTGAHVFEARGVSCRRSGRLGFTVRVLPHHPELVTRFVPGLITWAQK